MYARPVAGDLGSLQLPGQLGPGRERFSPRPLFRLALALTAPLSEGERSKTRHPHEALTILTEAVLTV